LGRGEIELALGLPRAYAAVAGACLGSLRRQFGAEMALELAQHMLVEVLSSPDIINTDPPPDGFALQE
jgi:hypothetical protein